MTLDEKEKEKKAEEYQNRYRFWTDKRISQLSFLNNFMLTIGIALITYIWTKEISFYMTSTIDWKITFLFITLASSFMSVLSGFILAMSRLYDLRLTSNILLTRKRALKKDIKLNNVKNQKNNFWESLKILVDVIGNFEDYKINSNDISNEKFKKLKASSNAIGSFTWRLLNIQVNTLAISIISLVCSSICAF